MTQNKALGYVFNIFDKGKSVKVHTTCKASIDNFGMWPWIKQNYQEGLNSKNVIFPLLSFPDLIEEERSWTWLDKTPGSSNSQNDTSFLVSTVTGHGRSSETQFVRVSFKSQMIFSTIFLILDTGALEHAVLDQWRPHWVQNIHQFFPNFEESIFFTNKLTYLQVRKKTIAIFSFIFSENRHVRHKKVHTKFQVFPWNSLNLKSQGHGVLTKCLQKAVVQNLLIVT